MTDPELLRALADLLWPILAAIVLLVTLPTVLRVAQNRPFKIKYGDMELSVQDVSEQLRKQVRDLQEKVTRMTDGRGSGASAALAEEAAPAATREAGETRSDVVNSILWVDDKPRNNAHEITKLQEDGWKVSTVETTEEALSVLESRRAAPTLIISDMGRREGLTYDRTAGLDLIREIRARGLRTPILLYTSPQAVRSHKEETLDAGGAGITASPIELFQLVESYGPDRPT